MKKRFIVIVLDSYGIGAMDDVPTLRPADIGANTCRQIFKHLPNLRLPNLQKMGLGNAFIAAGGNLSDLPQNVLCEQKEATFGVHKLAHFGADTFWGHQELMGTKPLKPFNAPFSESLQKVRETLVKAGFKIDLYTGNNDKNAPAILVVNDALTIGDNVETDLGNNYNVTAALDVMPFAEVLKVGRLVRSVVKVSRVIVFGGKKVSLSDLLNAYETTQNRFAGVSAPKSGVYAEAYEVQHLGFGVDPETQIPHCLDEINVRTHLIGKVADIIENPNGLMNPCVDTQEVMDGVLMSMQALEHGFICANVQETDLAGHRENAALYAEKLQVADAGIGKIIAALLPNDILVITADHGNDPTIGHAKHTRELTPLLIYGQKVKTGFVGLRESLADTGATAAEFFGAKAPQFGKSYLAEIL